MFEALEEEAESKSIKELWDSIKTHTHNIHNITQNILAESVKNLSKNGF